MKRATVTVVNPEQLSLPTASSRPRSKVRGKKGKSKKGKSKTPAAAAGEVGCMTTKRDSRGRFIKKGRRKKRRKSNPSPSPRRRSRSSGDGGGGRRRRRRRNPEGEGGGVKGAFAKATNLFIPKMLGKLATSYVVRRFGGDWGSGIFNQATSSPYAGAGWSLTNYAIAAGVGYVGGWLLDRWGGGRMKGWGKAFAESVYDDIFQRFFYTEIVARSEWGQKNFGQIDFIPTGYEDDVYGNRWATFPNSRYQQTMLGIETATPYDGLETATPMDGLTARSRRYDMRPTRAMARRPMGHYQESPWLMQGSHDPFAAAYM